MRTDRLYRMTDFARANRSRSLLHLYPLCHADLHSQYSQGLLCPLDNLGLDSAGSS